MPSGKSRDCGFDRSMILGYGQDDKVCALTSLFAMLEAENPERTGCCILADKEEIGNMGATVCSQVSSRIWLQRFSH